MTKREDEGESHLQKRWGEKKVFLVIERTKKGGDL